MFHTNTIYETRIHGNGIRIDPDIRERPETKQTSIIVYTRLYAMPSQLKIQRDKYPNII